jgi:hypothetical protein
MNKTIRVAVPAIVLGVILLLGATVAKATHSWGGYHWARTANPFTLKLGDNASSAWDAYLSTTSGDWSQSTVLDTTIVSGLGGRNCKAQTGRVEVCNRTYGNNGWIGLAQIWVSGSHITKGTAKMNDTYFNTATYNTSAWRNLVMCQEVGHTLGLDHQDEIFDDTNLGTCMDYTNNPESNQHPNQHDYDMLEQIYAHLDTFTTVSATKATGASALAQERLPAGGQGDFENVSEWGKEIRRSANGRESVFERDLGRGNKVLTHVTWADPAAK